MEHILNMEYSLATIKYFAELQALKRLPSLDIYCKATYPFCAGVEYEKEVTEYCVKSDKEGVNEILKRHLFTCEEIIKIWDERLRFMTFGASRIRYYKENNIDINDTYEIHCVLRKNIMSLFEEIVLLRINGEKKEIGSPTIMSDRIWHEYNPELITIPNTDARESVMSLVNFTKKIKLLLSKYVSVIKSVPTTEQPQQKELYFTRSFTKPERQKLFDGLVNGGFIPKGTTLNHFFFVFGGTETLDFKPLQWLGTIKELNYFINKFFPNEKYKWDKAVKCFIRNNTPINKKSLSTAIDKYDNPPEKSTMIDDFLR